MSSIAVAHNHTAASSSSSSSTSTSSLSRFVPVQVLKRHAVTQAPPPPPVHQSTPVSGNCTPGRGNKRKNNSKSTTRNKGSTTVTTVPSSGAFAALRPSDSSSSNGSDDGSDIEHDKYDNDCKGIDDGKIIDEEREESSDEIRERETIQGLTTVSLSPSHSLPTPPPPSSSSSSSRERVKLTGSSANVHWRAIPWTHLRTHPLYHSLPLTETVYSLSPSDYCLYRQDSWQWNALHQGRLTTSKVASILGFYESLSSTALSLPKSLSGHDRAVTAWRELTMKPPRDWTHLNADYKGERVDGEGEGESESVWIDEREGESRFAYAYRPTDREIDCVRGGTNTVRIDNAIHARLAWGSAQEATALLGLLNVLYNQERVEEKKDQSKGDQRGRRYRLRESGMQVLEAVTLEIERDGEREGESDMERERRLLYREIECKVTQLGTLPLIGASPDGLVDTVLEGETEGESVLIEREVVEVKCFSPFISNNTLSPSRNKKRETLRVSRYRPSNTTPNTVSGKSDVSMCVPVWHIPQLQLEMFCTGLYCHSALLVVLYIDGMMVYRVKRNDNVSELYYV